MEKKKNLQQFADRFIKFDENWFPEYCYDFDAKSRTFTRMRKFTNRELTSFELPTWDVPYSPVPDAAQNDNMLATLATYHERLANQPRLSPLSHTACEADLATYAQGGVTVASGCFKGYDHLQIVVPTNYAVRFNAACFDPTANVELVVPADMALKQVYHSHHDGWGVTQDHWTVLSHSAFAFQGVCGKDGYHSRDFDPAKDAPQRYLTVTHPQPRQKLSTCLMAKHQAVHAKVTDDLANLANRWVRVRTDLHTNLRDLRRSLHADLVAIHQNLHGNLQELHQNLHARFDADREK